MRLFTAMKQKKKGAYHDFKAMLITLPDVIVDIVDFEKSSASKCTV